MCSQGAKHATLEGDLPLHLAAEANASEAVLQIIARAYPGAVEKVNHDEKLPDELSKEHNHTYFFKLAAHLGRYVLHHGDLPFTSCMRIVSYRLQMAQPCM